MTDNFFNDANVTDETNTLENCRFVKPSSDFYSAFSEKQIIDIINSLEANKTIPHKYCYSGDGATSWDEFYSECGRSGEYPISNQVIEIVRESLSYINYQTQNYKWLNIVDIGPGNSYPVKELVMYFAQLTKLNKYIALDISKDIINISKINIEQWFPNLPFIGYPFDVETDSLTQILFENSQAIDNSEEAINLILYIGGTLSNHPDRPLVLKNIKRSMGENDLFILSKKINFKHPIETNTTNHIFLNLPKRTQDHYFKRYQVVRDYLGLLPEDCELVAKYEKNKSRQVLNIRVNADYVIEFNVLGSSKTVKIEKGEEINYWFHHASTSFDFIKELQENELQVIHFSIDKSLSHMLVICQGANNTNYD